MKKKATQSSSTPKSPTVSRILDFHRKQRERNAEMEKKRPHFDNLTIDGLATFTAEFECDSHDISHYETEIEFHRSVSKLIIYPNRDNNPPSNEKQIQLKTQFHMFSNDLEAALNRFPGKLRKLCRQYDLDIANAQADHEFINSITWKLIKLESLNWIECYTLNHSISRDFDIVLRFKRRKLRNTYRLKHVYFDG